MSGADFTLTFPQMLERWARTAPGGVGLREQHHGIWRDWTWSAIWETCADLGEGLLASGFAPGDRIGYMGDPSLEGLLLTLAAQGIGGIPFGIYPTTPPEGVHYLLEDAGATAFVGEDQEFIDKALAGEPPDEVKLVVAADPRGMFDPDYDDVVPWAELRRRGAERRSEHPGDWEERVAAGTVDDVCGIYYTSGTTGEPKGVALTTANLMHGYPAAFGDEPNQLPAPTPRDRCLHDVPVASLAGPMFGIYLPLAFGMVGHVPDKRESAEDAFVAVAPSVYLGFPRGWELRASRALVAIETSSWLRRFAFRRAMSLRRAGVERGGLRRLGAGLAYWLVTRQMLDQWGLLRMRCALSGGAPLSPDLLRLWRLWGLQIRQLYGMTESGGLATIQADDAPEVGIAGTALPGMEVRIAEDQEILMRGPGVFGGYWNRDQATAEALDADGWLHSGDIGILRADGNLEVVDRKRDVLILGSGTAVPASSVEHVLKYSPYVRDALLIGERRPFLAALIEIDMESVAQWARTQNVSYTGFTNLATNPQVVGLLETELETANATLRERGSETVDRIAVLPKELDPEDPTEITATRKIRRRELASKFSELVDELYRTDDSARLVRHTRG